MYYVLNEERYPKLIKVNVIRETDKMVFTDGHYELIIGSGFVYVPKQINKSDNKLFQTETDAIKHILSILESEIQQKKDELYYLTGIAEEIGKL